MSWILALIGLIYIIKEKVKELKEPVIPASYWNNKPLILEDELNPDITTEQFMKNLQNGK